MTYIWAAIIILGGLIAVVTLDQESQKNKLKKIENKINEGGTNYYIKLEEKLDKIEQIKKDLHFEIQKLQQKFCIDNEKLRKLIEGLEDRINKLEDEIPEDWERKINIQEIKLSQNRFLLLFNQLTKPEQNKFKKNNSIKHLEDKFSWSTLNFKNMKFNDILNLRVPNKRIYEHLIHQLEELQKSKEVYNKYKTK